MRKVPCDKCGETFNGDYTDIELEKLDEVICPDCEQNAAENAYERLCEDFHDGGSTAPWPETVRLQQEAARKLK